MNLNNRRTLAYWIVTVMFVVGITVVIHASFPSAMHPEMFYALAALWALLVSNLLFALYRRDIESDAQLRTVRFADTGAALVLESRKAAALVIEAQTQVEVELSLATGIRAALNLAHEYFSFVTNEYCTANIAVIMMSTDSKRVCRITHYDDFVPPARQEKELEIPIDNSLFGYLIERNLGAITIDDYTVSAYPIYPVPIIREGFCRSGICVPIKVFQDTEAFFNVDSSRRNIFKPNIHEKAAVFFAEILGQLIQVAGFKLAYLRDAGRVTFLERAPNRAISDLLVRTSTPGFSLGSH